MVKYATSILLQVNAMQPELRYAPDEEYPTLHSLIEAAILKERERCLAIVRNEPWITMYQPDGDACFRHRIYSAIERGVTTADQGEDNV